MTRTHASPIVPVTSRLRGKEAEDSSSEERVFADAHTREHTDAEDAEGWHEGRRWDDTEWEEEGVLGVAGSRGLALLSQLGDGGASPRRLPDLPPSPGRVLPEPARAISPPPDPNDLVTPLLPSGYSPSMIVGGRRGRFNFNEPPSTGGTPGSRYAFDTEDGGRWHLQLERAFQGGRWDDAHHAPDDFDGYKAMDPEERTRQMGEMWGEDSPIGRVVDRASADGVSFRELQKSLAHLNTHRQISDWKDK